MLTQSVFVAIATTVCLPRASAQACSPDSLRTVAYSDSFGPTTPPWASSELVLPQFDSSFGRLVRATLVVDLDMAGHVAGENLSMGGPCTLSWTIATSVDVRMPGVSLPNPFVEVVVNGTEQLSAFDGVMDVSGPSAFSHPLVEASDWGSTTIVDPAVLDAVFIGSGNVTLEHDGNDLGYHVGAVSLLYISGNQSILSARLVYTYCPGSFAPYCAGDGSLATECPCSNPGSAGHGCDNSDGTGGARLTASGSVSPDTVVLTSTGGQATSTSIFLQGTASEANGIVFGDGVRCVGGTLMRLYVKSASAGSVSAPTMGEPTITSRSASLGDPIAPGHPRFYQVHYRDPDLAFCPAPSGGGFNVSSALRIVW